MTLLETTDEFPAWSDQMVAHHFARLEDVTLHYVTAGKGPLVVLLHGFPEFWYSWRHQIPVLVEAGYRVVAPDQRGYNRSDKPKKVSDYRIEKLVADIAGLIEVCGEQSAVIVGHDWGAAVAWAFAMTHPEMTERLVICNVPHPLMFEKGLRTLKQLRKSWYMGAFQLPGIPERAWAARDFALLRRLLKNDPTNENAFTDEDIERYVEAMSQPGALTGAINWYRAIARHYPRELYARIDAPTLVIWGCKDVALGEELAVPPPEAVPNCRVEKLPDISHWTQVDAPEKVNALLLHFLAESA